MNAGRPKGYPKSGGRKSGTPNKKTESFNTELEAKGFNLVDRIIALADNCDDYSIQLKLIELVAKYNLPVPKAAESIEESVIENLDSSIISIVESDDN